MGEKRGSFGVELEGEIAAMVELARGPERNKAAPGGTAVRGPFRRSVKVVAGARNHRELTLHVYGFKSRARYHLYRTAVGWR